jgi:cell division protein FtsW
VAILIALLLLAVLVPHVGRVINGSRRWIGFGGIGLQPSELSKLGIVIYLSYYLSGKTLDLHKFFYDFGPMLLVLIAYICLLLLEPDMGTATVVFIISLSMFYMSDISRKFILTLTAIGVVGFIFLVIVEPYRIRRFLGFMNPWDDALGKGYQLTHSLLAVGHGGWLGVGIGNSIEKLFYLPEAHTDFILAIIAEETGILGVSIILLLFFIIFYRGFTVIATESRYLMNRKFQSMVAQGISVWFLVQALINIGVTIGILPTKGLTLPFISYGGSSILINFIALAILLKIDYENKQIKRGVEVE